MSSIPHRSTAEDRRRWIQRSVNTQISDPSTFFLDCSNLQLDDAGAMVVADILSTQPFGHFQGIHFGNNQIGDQGAVALAAVFRQAQVLPSRIIFHSNRIGDTGGASLIEAVQSNCFSDTAVKLDLGSNQIGDEGGYAVAEALADNHNTGRLVVLHLDHNDLAGAGGGVVLESLAQNRSLQEMYFDDNTALNGPVVTNGLAQAVRHNRTLQKLGLAMNHLGDDAVKALAQALRENTALTWLGLSDNNISVEGARALCAVLPTNNCLTAVDLSDNPLGNEGVTCLVKCLGSLQRLDLNGVQMGDKGAAATAQALDDDNCPLRFLYLASNHIGDEGTRSLAEAVATRNKRLAFLSLAANELGPEGGQTLVDAVEARYRYVELQQDSHRDANSDDNGDGESYQLLEIDLNDNAYLEEEHMEAILERLANLE